MTVLAAQHWQSNAELIYDVSLLGYLKPEWQTLDPTYGKGTWWKKFRPDHLTTHVRDMDGSDFRDLPYGPNAFDVCVFDPPYVSVGGRKTTTIPDMHNAYGLSDAPTSPELVQMLINDGLKEMNRLATRYILVKCQDYISSGRLFPGTFRTWEYAQSIGMTLVDRFVHVTKAPRPQPIRERQVHARNNLSVLFVFKPS